MIPGQGPAANVVWTTLRRKYPADEPVATAARLRRLFRGGLRTQEFAALLDEIAGDIPNRKAEDADGQLKILAALCEQAGRIDLARRCHEQTVAVRGTMEDLVQFGDFLARQKLWNEAANRYAQASGKVLPFPTGEVRFRGINMMGAIPSYLRGWALRKAGQEAEGRELQDRALLTPLGLIEDRYELAKVLARNDLNAEAERQCDIAICLSDRHTFGAPFFLSRRATLAEKAGNFLVAADNWERNLLHGLWANTSLGELEAYLVQAQRVHQFRTRGYLSLVDRHF